MDNVNANRSNPRQLWLTIDRLLGRCKLSPCDQIPAEQFRLFFDTKVEKIRDSTAGSPAFTFSDLDTNIRLSSFDMVSAADIISAIFCSFT